MKRFFLLSGLFASLFTATLFSCKHDPFIPVDPDTPSGGTCDPDTVYFQNQVLPLLISNCTESGCHNSQDRAEGVVVDSYESLMATVDDVKRTTWSKNDLIKSLTTSESDERMPLNKPAFTTAQIDLLKKWISQGAQNNSCDEAAGVCDTINGSGYNLFVKPLVQVKCQGCHSGSNPQGGVKLTTYSEIRTYALNGSFYSSVTRASNWMPLGGSKLDDCSLAKLRVWVAAGAPEN